MLKLGEHGAPFKHLRLKDASLKRGHRPMVSNVEALNLKPNRDASLHPRESVGQIMLTVNIDQP